MVQVKFGVTLCDFPEQKVKGRHFIKNTLRYTACLDQSYESVWFPDHFIQSRYTSKENDVLECFTTLSYLSALNPHLDFGSIVLCSSYRNPALIAKMSATLSMFTGGRFILGIGAGWHEPEYKQYGYDFPSRVTRIRQMGEAVQIIKMMLTQDNVSFNGRFYRVENAYCNPKPDPQPLIMIGGGGEKYTLKLVARYADWWNDNMHDLDDIKRKIRVLEHHCDELGRNPDDILKTQLHMVAIAGTDEEAIQLAKKSSFYNLGLKIIGSPETVTSQLSGFIDAGIEYFQLMFTPFPNVEATQLFAEQVIPELT